MEEHFYKLPSLEPHTHLNLCLFFFFFLEELFLLLSEANPSICALHPISSHLIKDITLAILPSIFIIVIFPVLCHFHHHIKILLFLLSSKSSVCPTTPSAAISFLFFLVQKKIYRKNCLPLVPFSLESIQSGFYEAYTFLQNCFSHGH